MNTKLMITHTLTPLQAGTGQGLGLLDLPIAREVSTNLPYLPGSSFKGVLRDICDKNDRFKLFGPETANASDHAGTVRFTDMRLLLLPIRSLAGTFSWVSSPFVLNRFARDYAISGGPKITLLPHFPQLDTALTSNDSALFIRPNGTTREIVLEDLLLSANKENSEQFSNWATSLAQLIFPGDTEWQTIFTERLCIVADDTFNFLMETATEVVARIRLQEDSKTVEKGGLWYEELLPAETILYGLIVATPIKAVNLSAEQLLDKVRNLTQTPALQFGGGATVGRGLCRLVMGK